MKACSRCKGSYNIQLFRKNRNKKDGLHSQCKACELEYRNRTREDRLVKSKAYYVRNRDLFSSKHKLYRSKNKEILKAYRANYRRANVVKEAIWKGSWYTKNVKNISRKAKERYRTDYFHALKSRVRHRTREAFKRAKIVKPNKTHILLGCTYSTLMRHIESLFTSGMTWENRGKWHIDHIIPLASATNEEELIKLCHYTNLQPLWAVDNLRKGSKI